MNFVFIALDPLKAERRDESGEDQTADIEISDERRKWSHKRYCNCNKRYDQQSRAPPGATFQVVDHDGEKGKEFDGKSDNHKCVTI